MTTYYPVSSATSYPERPQPRILRDGPDWDSLLGNGYPFPNRPEQQIPRENVIYTVVPRFPIPVHYAIDGTEIKQQDSSLADGIRGNPPTPRAPPYPGRYLKAKEIVPDIQCFEIMYAAMLVFAQCKEIFDVMDEEMKQHCNGNHETLESQIFKETGNLRESATESLHVAKKIVQFHVDIARVLDGRLEDIITGKDNGTAFSFSDLSDLFDKIAEGLSSLNSSVLKIRASVDGLVSLIEGARDCERSAGRRRDKLWKWLMRVFDCLAKVLNMGGKLASPFGPAGAITGVVMSAASPICAGIAKICEKRLPHTHVASKDDRKLDEFIQFLQYTLLPEAHGAENKLVDFPPFKLVYQALFDAQQSGEQISIPPNEAYRAWHAMTSWFSEFDTNGRKEGYIQGPCRSHAV